MSDAQRGEGFACIPGNEPLDAAGAFVLPDALSQFPGVDCTLVALDPVCALELLHFLNAQPEAGCQQKGGKKWQKQSHAFYFTMSTRSVKLAFCLYLNFCV
jgi:hypothetical protein